MARTTAGVVRALGLGVAVATLAVGCGGSSSSGKTQSQPSSGSQPSTGASSAAAPTGTPVKIGLLASLTGTGGSSVKYTATTIKAWGDWVNANGGLNGHPVQISVEDSKSDPAAAIAAAQKLVNTTKVDTIVLGDPTSELAAGKFLSASGVPIIGFGYTPIWNTAPNFFETSGVIPLLYTITPATAAAVGAKNVGSIACSEVPTCSSGAAAYGPAGQALGLKYSGVITAPSTAASYTAECLKLQQKGADYIQATFASATVVRVAQSCTQQNYKGWIGLSSGSTVAKDFQSVKNVKWAGSIWAWPWWSTQQPAQDYKKIMDQYNSGNSYQDANSSAIWAALEVLHKASASLGATVSPQAVMDSMYTIKDETLGGMLAQPVTFTKGQPSPVVNCMFAFKLENGTFTTATAGAAGNGATGDLQSICFPPKK
jgi:branched-chain amino acid transport system substrate-binding protein